MSMMTRNKSSAASASKLAEIKDGSLESTKETNTSQIAINQETRTMTVEEPKAAGGSLSTPTNKGADEKTLEEAARGMDNSHDEVKELKMRVGELFKLIQLNSPEAQRTPGR